MAQRRRKAVVGLALAAVPVLALAAPAAADAQNGQTQTVTYEIDSEGVRLRCSIEGHVRYIWDEETNTTRMDAYTKWYDPVSPEGNVRCQNAIDIASVSVGYKDDDEQNSLYADGSARLIASSSTVEGRASNMSGHHEVSFLCDNAQGQLHLCLAQVDTRAK
jgi:hypothetical protein